MKKSQNPSLPAAEHDANEKQKPDLNLAAWAAIIEAFETASKHTLQKARNPANDWRTTARLLGEVDGIENAITIFENLVISWSSFHSK